MKDKKTSERLIIEEVKNAGKSLRIAARGSDIGFLIRIIRLQLGMSQKALAKRAQLPQSTISRIEKKKGETTLSTLHKLTKAIFCELLIVPILEDSIEMIRRRQARKVAEKHVRYLQGTMNLEDQQPDPQFLMELIRQEEELLLQGPSMRLWEEDV